MIDDIPSPAQAAVIVGCGRLWFEYPNDDWLLFGGAMLLAPLA